MCQFVKENVTGIPKIILYYLQVLISDRAYRAIVLQIKSRNGINRSQLGAVTTMMQFIRIPLTFIKNAEQYAQLVDKRSLPANMTIMQHVEALIAKTGSIEKELHSLQQCADASEDETLKTWFKQVEVHVPHLARQNPVCNTDKSLEKKSAPETLKEVSAPTELQK